MEKNKKTKKYLIKTIEIVLRRGDPSIRQSV